MPRWCIGATHICTSDNDNSTVRMFCKRATTYI